MQLEVNYILLFEFIPILALIWCLKGTWMVRFFYLKISINLVSRKNKINTISWEGERILCGIFGERTTLSKELLFWVELFWRVVLMPEEVLFFFILSKLASPIVWLKLQIVSMSMRIFIQLFAKFCLGRAEHLLFFTLILWIRNLNVIFKQFFLNSIDDWYKIFSQFHTF